MRIIRRCDNATGTAQNTTTDLYAQNLRICYQIYHKCIISYINSIEDFIENSFKIVFILKIYKVHYFFKSVETHLPPETITALKPFLGSGKSV